MILFLDYNIIIRNVHFFKGPETTEGIMSFTQATSSYYQVNKLTSVFRASIKNPIIDHEFSHNIVKVAVDPQVDSQVDSQTTFTILTGQTHEKLMSNCFFTITNCPLLLVDALYKLLIHVSVCILTIKISQ